MTYYFSHKKNIRDNYAVGRIVHRYGIEGYGLFWILLERLCETENEMEFNSEELSAELKVPESLLMNIAKEPKVFTLKENVLSSPLIKFKKSSDDDRRFSDYKSKDELLADFKSKYTFLAYMFWKLWYMDQKTKTITDAKVADWTDEIRKIIELDAQKTDRLIAVYEFFKKAHLGEAGYDTFWFSTIRSVGAFRNKNRNGVYCLDQIANKVNDKIAHDRDFQRLIEKQVKTFNNYAGSKLS